MLEYAYDDALKWVLSLSVIKLWRRFLVRLSILGDFERCYCGWTHCFVIQVRWLFQVLVNPECSELEG